MPLPNQLTPLGSLKRVAFFDPVLGASAKFQPSNNPEQIVLKPNSVRKYVATTNGTSVIMGGREYPPKEISLTWSQMDASDLESLRPYVYTSPIAYVDNNDQGYLGVLVFDEIEQLAGRSFLCYSVKASFLVLAPYNGLITNINQLAPPTLTQGSVTTTGGYLPASTTLYFWTTVFTPWGESLTGTGLTAAVGATGTNTNWFPVTFTAPSSSWYRKTRLYWNTTNNPATATLLTEILAGQTASFNVYSPYFQYSTLVPPTYSSAFTGYWAAGKWIQQ